MAWRALSPEGPPAQGGNSCASHGLMHSCKARGRRFDQAATMPCAAADKKVTANSGGQVSQQGTPSSITKQVKRLCRRVGSTALPIFLRVERQADAQPLECFENV